jgi:hypothetical protein
VISIGTPSDCVIKISSEEIGNRIEEQGKIIDIRSIFSCCYCNHIVIERRITRMKEIDHLFFNFFHMLISVYACRFLVVEVDVTSRL